MFFIIRSCYSNFPIFTWSYFFLFTHFYIFIIDIFCFKWLFNFLNNWFCTYSYYPIFFFSDSFCSFCWVTNWFRVFDLLSDSYFFLTWLTFIFYNLTTSFKVFIIDYLSFIRNISFDSFGSFAFSWFYWWNFTNILSSNSYYFILFFYKSFSVFGNFFTVFYLNSCLGSSCYAFLIYYRFSSFKIRIFYYFSIKSLFAFISEFSISLGTIFNNLVLWFNSFFSYFKLACFLVKGNSIFYRTFFTFFNNNCLASF